MASLVINQKSIKNLIRMKHEKIIAISIALTLPAIASAQGAIDALRLTQPDLMGTARYMSMGGAFGALGGDLTTLSQNPGGIGVYRSHELGFTLNLDAQNAKSASGDLSLSQNQTKFYLNNIGGVLTLKLNSSAVPNLNFGFTYNKTASFNKAYRGNLGALSNSMTNWMAGMANAENLTEAEVTIPHPYKPDPDQYAPSWMSILAYNSFFINPYEVYDPNYQSGYRTDWEGQWGDALYDETGSTLLQPGTSGTANYAVTETGSVDSFNIAFGGNIANVVYWGMDFDITNLNYTRNTYYGENLQNAYVMSDKGVEPTTSEWNLRNYYNVSGNGFAYKLGFIVKPIQELRIGFAFHTPTFYNLSQQFGANTAYSYNHEAVKENSTNEGVPGGYSFNFRTPWKILASVAGVIGSKFIISADYEWAQYSKMKFSDPGSYGGYDSYFDWDYVSSSNSYDADGTNGLIQNYFQNTNTFRLGAEYRVTPFFSVRAGYANVSSPVKTSVRENRQVVYTAGTQPDYTFSNSTNYITAGVGFRVKGFYADLAYVYRNEKATYHAFTDDPSNFAIQSPKADLSLTRNHVVLSLGYKFGITEPSPDAVICEECV